MSDSDRNQNVAEPFRQLLRAFSGERPREKEPVEPPAKRDDIRSLETLYRHWYWENQGRL